MTSTKATAPLLALTTYLWLLACSAVACNVPVFRYALERWDADIYYALVVYGSAGLTESEQSAYDLLRKYSISDYGAINLDVYQYSRDALAQSEFAPLFLESDASSDEATVYLFHPLSAEKTGPIWEAPLTVSNVHRILADPDRLELITRIASGTSFVMVMLESGDPERDEAAWQRLSDAMATVSDFLPSPEGIELHDGTIIGNEYMAADPANKLMSPIPLKLEFDLQRIPRTEANSVLTSSLLSVDPKLAGMESEPMVFPVFARGRFIYPMIGDEITEDNVLYVSNYICGACSCEIKVQNPGMDLPVLMDWEAALYGDEPIATMQQFLSAESIAKAASASDEDDLEITITIDTVTLGMLVISAIALVGIVLFIRRRLS
ncbi:MAG: hypothetical protein AB3N63_05430 [Puniceicoccaceae bacterium]